MNEIFLSDNQIAERYGVSRITVWRWHRDNPEFPRVVKLSPGCARWRLSEIEAWEQAKSTQCQKDTGTKRELVEQGAWAS